MQKSLMPFILLFLVPALSMLAADRQDTCEKWQVLDIPFQLMDSTNRPLEVVFGATIRHQEGRTMDVPGFYNGDSTWVLRFCPDEEGKWSLITYSSIPELSGKSAGIEVIPNTDPEEHGPVTISPGNRRKFIYEDGTPYFLLAFELDWLFALDWDNPRDIPRTREIISYVSESGFNQVIMNVYAYDASWGHRTSIRPEYNFARPEVFPFGGNNADPDYSTINTGFFRHLDRVITHLDEQDIAAHLMIYVWNKQVNWPPPGSEADNRYFDYVVKRYQAFPNLIWDISKEALAHGRDDMGYITERIQRLRNLDAHGRLLTVHDYSYCREYPGQVDFISVQDWSPDIYDSTQDVLQRHTRKPVLNIEHGGYEKTMHSIFNGAYTDPAVCLDRNYRIIFAGGYSTYYWQNSAWYEVVYNISELAPGMRPHLSYYRHLSALFAAYPFHNLAPLHSVFAPYGLTDHHTHYLFYCPGGMVPLQGDIPGLKGKVVRIKWFDPFTGEIHEAETRHFNRGSLIGINRPEKLTTPFSVVILEVVEEPG